MSQSLRSKILRPDGTEQAATLDLAAELTVTGPLVSCLMVSRGNAFPAAFAIESFRRQTYTNRELVIVCDRPGSAVETLVLNFGNPAIRYVEAAPATLGELRNTSIAHARGELLCQWDDDDLYADDRIAIQVAAMALADTKASFLLRFSLWWPARRLWAMSQERVWEGSLLAERGIVPVYQALPREEDVFVTEAIMALHPLILIDAPRAYCYIVHGNNTCTVPHFERMFAYASASTAPESYEDALDAAAEALPLRPYERALKEHERAFAALAK